MFVHSAKREKSEIYENGKENFQIFQIENTFKILIPKQKSILSSSMSIQPTNGDTCKISDIFLESLDWSLL